jgi:thymidylate kinase
VHEGYRAIVEREPQRVVTVDARGTPAQTHRKIKDTVKKKLNIEVKG